MRTTEDLPPLYYTTASVWLKSVLFNVFINRVCACMCGHGLADLGSNPGFGFCLLCDFRPMPLPL